MIRANFRANILERGFDINVAPDAKCRVLKAGTSTEASIYADETTVVTLPNPLPADALGWVDFYVEGGKYDIQIELGTDILKLENQLLIASDGNGEMRSMAGKEAGEYQTAAEADSKYAVPSDIPDNTDSLQEGNVNLYFSEAEKLKLAAIADNADVTADNTAADSLKLGGQLPAHYAKQSDVSNIDNTSDADKPVSTAQQLALDDKVDKVTGKGLSTNDFTDPLKTKLEGLQSSHFRGTFVDLVALQSGVTNPVAGDYADVDGGVGEDVERYIYDSSDESWVQQGSGAGGGQVNSIVAGSGIAVDATDPANPVVNVDIGTGMGQVMAGADSRVTNLKNGAYSETGVDIPPLGQDGLVPSAYLPAQFSGDYDDLTNKPALGTAAALGVDTDVSLTANSDSLIPSQKAVKAYVDSNSGGGGLSAYVAETINQPWDYVDGVTINGAKYGQDFGPLSPCVSYSASNADDGGTIEVDFVDGVIYSSTSNSLIYATNAALLDVADISNDGGFYWIISTARSRDLSTQYNEDRIIFDRDSSGNLSFTRAYNLIFDNDNSSEIQQRVGDGYSTAQVLSTINNTEVLAPIDGRILTEQVTASRTLTVADIGKILICTGSNDITLTVPVGLQDKSFNCVIHNKTYSNVVTIADDATSDIFNRHGEYDIALGGVASLLPTLETDEYTLVGETV